MNRTVSEQGKAADRELQGWFGQRRNFFVRQLLDDFFHILRSFQRLYGQYLACGRGRAHGPDVLLADRSEKIRHHIWDQLNRLVGTELDKGPLWLLKDLCHRLWPENEEEQDLHGSLMDWMVGSIFHEAMKLKENIYLLNAYAPAAVRMRGRRPDHSSLEGSSHPWLTQIVDIELLIRRTAADVIRQMEQIAFLFGQTNFLLRSMLPSFRANSLLLRFLVEQEDLVEELWGERSEELFAEMFDGLPADGFCRAGRSYMDSNWYPQALCMYRRALELDSGCDEAIARMAQLKTIVQENREFLEAESSLVGQ